MTSAAKEYAGDKRIRSARITVTALLDMKGLLGLCLLRYRCLLLHFKANCYTLNFTLSTERLQVNFYIYFKFLAHYIIIIPNSFYRKPLTLDIYSCSLPPYNMAWGMVIPPICRKALKDGKGKL